MAFYYSGKYPLFLESRTTQLISRIRIRLFGDILFRRFYSAVKSVFVLSICIRPELNIDSPCLQMKNVLNGNRVMSCFSKSVK